MLAGCAAVLGPGEPDVYTAAPPSAVERYCAWFGDAVDGTLYFGESAFWSALRRAGGDPLADLAHAGPVRIGRFDLAEEVLREPLDVGSPGDRAGPWDVLAHPNGRIYFTRYFEPAGWIDPASGELRHLPELGQGLNEIALGPDGRLFVSRYPAPDGTPGGLVVLDEEGALLAEHPLPALPGYVAAPKTVAVDPERGDVWLAMDWLPADRTSGAPIRHDAYVLAGNGDLLRRIERPHLHFAAFGEDGTGYFAEVDGGVLSLRMVSPEGDPLDPLSGGLVRLDPDFPEELDFAQEVRPLPGGGAVVTRWSGRVHVVDAAGRVRTLRLPALEDAGLYYTGVLRDGRVCATYCAGVRVVCADVPEK